MQKNLSVQLGESPQHPWTVSPPDYRVIGTVRRGMEMGQLAIAPDGHYVQVNGSWVKDLNTSQVLAAIRKAVRPHGRPTHGPASGTAHTQPTVVVRKRRKIVLPPE